MEEEGWLVDRIVQQQAFGQAVGGRRPQKINK